MRDCLAQLYKTARKYKSRKIVSTAPRSESGEYQGSITIYDLLWGLSHQDPDTCRNTRVASECRRRPPDSEDASGRSDSPTVKPARMAARGSTAAQEPAGTSAGIFVKGPLPAGIHHLQCGPPCICLVETLGICARAPAGATCNETERQFGPTKIGRHTYAGGRSCRLGEQRQQGKHGGGLQSSLSSSSLQRSRQSRTNAATRAGGRW